MTMCQNRSNRLSCVRIGGIAMVFVFHHLPEITTSSGVLTAVNEGANVMFEPSEREHVYNHSTYLMYIYIIIL